MAPVTTGSATDPSQPQWKPRAIIFDLLTALLDSWTLWDASVPSSHSSSSDIGRTWRARYLELTFGCGSYVPYESLVRQAAQDVGLPDSAPDDLLENWDHLAPWPEVAAILPRLRSKGYLLGTVTNCSTEFGQRAAKRAWGGVDKDEGKMTWDAVVTAEQAGFYKPVREVYEACLKAFGVDASEVLFVAGSAGDVEGASKAGMRVVWHNRVGLAKVGETVPLREGKRLDEVLQAFL